MEKYDPIRILGEGSFGKVYLMRDKRKRTLVCVKVIKIKNIPKKERDATKLEVDLLRRLHHPNIVGYLDSFLSKNKETLCICMEYCDGGDLASQIKAARKNLFSESKILHWFVQLALGLHYMHSNRVLHRDLKTQNIFLLGNGRLVLGDLGISKVLDGTMDFAQTCIGTPYYMSPEIFQNKPYSYKSDVWALGCVLYEMTTLNHAFDANSLNGLAGKIIKGKYPPISSKYSKYLRELISQMLLINPQQRPDVDQILRKPFIKKHIINFFTDIASRPHQSLGEGTMIVKAAVGGDVMSSDIQNDSNVIALQTQLKELDMTKAVAEALAPRKPPVDASEAKKMVKEQAGALRREEEHKRMVEAALEKLRQEREIRNKQRESRMSRGSAVDSSKSKVSVPYGARREDPIKPAASRQPSQVSAAGIAIGGCVPNGQVRDGGLGWQQPSNRRQNSDNARPPQYGNDGRRRVPSTSNPSVEELRKKASDERKVTEDRRREDVRNQARQMEDARHQEEERKREEMAARQRMEELRAQAQQQSEREKLRERERARQREEIEQLKRDKIELDRLAAERERIRAEKLAEERRKVDDSRRERSGFDYVQEKQGGVGLNHTPRDKRGSYYPSEEKDDGLTARDRVLQRKMEKQAQEDAERMRLLRDAEEENRRIRAVAKAQKAGLYQASPGIIATEDQALPSYNQISRQSQLSNDQSDAQQLARQLEEATTGVQQRYESATESAQTTQFGAYISDDDNEDDELDLFEKAAQRRRARMRSDGRPLAANAMSGVDDDDNDGDSDVEVEETIQRREEELQAELTLATLRVRELQRTLNETKSMIGKPDELAKANGRKSSILENEEALNDDEYDEEEDVDDYAQDAFDPPDDSPRAPQRRNSDAKIEFDSRFENQRARNDNENKTPRNIRPSPIDMKSSASPVANPRYQNLQDPPTPPGRLVDRIQRIRERCVEGLGRGPFLEAYNFLKNYHENSQAYDGRPYDDVDREKEQGIRQILGDSKAMFGKLIEQLILIEETYGG